MSLSSSSQCSTPKKEYFKADKGTEHLSCLTSACPRAPETGACTEPCGGEFVSHLMVLSEEPLTTSLSLYCRHAMPRLWPFKVRTNSQVLVFHTCDRKGGGNHTETKLLRRD